MCEEASQLFSQFDLSSAKKIQLAERDSPQSYIAGAFQYTAKIKKGCFGNWSFGPMEQCNDLPEWAPNNLPNSQFPKQPLLNQLYNGSVNSMHYHPPNCDICLLSSEALVSILNSQGCEVIKLIDVQFLCSRTIFQTTYSNYYSWPLIWPYCHLSIII